MKDKEFLCYLLTILNRSEDGERMTASEKQRCEPEINNMSHLWTHRSFTTPLISIFRWLAHLNPVFSLPARSYQRSLTISSSVFWWPLSSFWDLMFQLLSRQMARFLNPKSSYGRILTAPPCRLISLLIKGAGNIIWSTIKDRSWRNPPTSRPVG